MSMPMPAKAMVASPSGREGGADLRAVDVPPEEATLDDEHRHLQDLDHQRSPPIFAASS